MKAEEESEAAQDLTVSAADLKQQHSSTNDAKQNTFAAASVEDLKADRVSAELKQHINNLGLAVARQNTFSAVQGSNHEDLKQQPERMEEEEEEEEEEMPEDLTERRPPLETYKFAAEVPRRPEFAAEVPRRPEDEEESIGE